jgi:hypothetical protein
MKTLQAVFLCEAAAASVVWAKAASSADNNNAFDVVMVTDE